MSHNTDRRPLTLLLPLFLLWLMAACATSPAPNDNTPTQNTPTSRLDAETLLGNETDTQTAPTAVPTATNATPSGKTDKPNTQQRSDPTATRLPAGGSNSPTPASNATNTSDLDDTIPADEVGWWLFTTGNDVRDLAYDEVNGLLYAATGGGLVQWNPATGESRKQIIYDGLISHDVLAVAVCPNGRVYVGTERGLGIYDPATDSWENWTTDNRATLKDNAITAVFCTETQLLIGYELDGLDIITLADQSVQHLDRTNNGLYSNAIDHIVQTPNGDLWLSAGFGLTIYTPATNTAETWDEENGLPDDSIFHMAVAPDGTVWLGTIDGAMRRNAQGTWELFSQDNVANMPIGLVRDVAPTAEGRVWLGLSSGDLCLLNPATSTCDETVDNSRDVSLTSLLLAPDDTLYLSTDNGISRWQNGRELPPLLLQNQIPTNEISAFAEDSAGYVWVGTDSGVFRSAPADVTGRDWVYFDRDNSGLTADIVNVIQGDPVNGGVWIGTYGGASYFDGQNWFTLDEQPNLPDDIIRALAVDALGQLWLGTDDGLSVWNGRELNRLTTAEGLPSDEILALLYDPAHDTVWVGTEDGLGEIDPTTAVVQTTFTEANGQLPHTAVNALALDTNGDLLLANERILLRYAHQNQPFLQLGNLDSYRLTSIAVNPRNGDIWVGTTGDYVYLYEATGNGWTHITDSGPSHQVLDILVDRLGTVWLAGNSYNEGGGGLGRYIPAASTTGGE
ncbi:MAG: hypothetical protein KDD89_08055 [Anaerolineales bacterium]|nr:hypothetical protein [Anaerolineales bacterium]